jgi:hypothetical protein
VRITGCARVNGDEHPEQERDRGPIPTVVARTLPPWRWRGRPVARKLLCAIGLRTLDRGGRARDRRRWELRAARARRENGRRRGAGARGGRGRSPLRTRARDSAAARTRPYESRDRRAALHLRPHGRIAPRTHHPEAAALDPSRARAIRALTRIARRRRSPSARSPGRRRVCPRPATSRSARRRCGPCPQ